MNSINSMLSPEDFTWRLPSVSQSLSQRAVDATTASAPRQPITFQTYGPFHPLSTTLHQASVGLSNDDHRDQQSEDYEMGEEADTQLHHQHPTGQQNIPKSVSRRSRYGTLDWDSHKEELKKLYMDENQNLDNTMRIMKERHSFPDSKKLYKERFKVWGWQKNLPGQYAQWMTQKANKRKRDDGKETVFFYGGLQWDKSKAQRSAVRSKKVSTGTEVIVVDTPNDIDYNTPRDEVVSPRNALSPGRPGNPIVARQVVVESESSPSESEDGAQDLSLNWNGNTRSELIAMFQAARSHADSERAETLFLDALKGYGFLLGPTHEDATKVAIAVANFYTEQGRSNDADKVVGDLCQHHIKKFGIDHRRTQQVILQVVELLNGCNRQIDALAFLGRSKELAEANIDEVSPKANKRSKTHRRGNPFRRHAAAPSTELLDAAQEITAGNDPAQVDYGIQVARTHVAAKDEAVEAFLKAIIKHCEHDGEALEIQNLQAWAELTKLYNKLGQSVHNYFAFSSAVETAEAIIGRQKWEKECFKSFETMEATLELAASVLEARFDFEAAKTFEKIEQKADDSFGWDDERTIWAKISIGIIYQKHRDWEHAKPWFDHALAASYAANGDEDGITRSLLKAMDKRHFSYVSDEGRPFKTIFGVSGFTIRPSRLHLD